MQTLPKVLTRMDFILSRVASRSFPVRFKCFFYTSFVDRVRLRFDSFSSIKTDALASPLLLHIRRYDCFYFLNDLVVGLFFASIQLSFCNRHCYVRLHISIPAPWCQFYFVQPNCRRNLLVFDVGCYPIKLVAIWCRPIPRSWVLGVIFPVKAINSRQFDLPRSVVRSSRNLEEGEGVSRVIAAIDFIVFTSTTAEWPPFLVVELDANG